MRLVFETQEPVWHKPSAAPLLPFAKARDHPEIIRPWTHRDPRTPPAWGPGRALRSGTPAARWRQAGGEGGAEAVSGRCEDQSPQGTGRGRGARPYCCPSRRDKGRGSRGGEGADVEWRGVRPVTVAAGARAGRLRRPGDGPRGGGGSF